MGLFLFWLAGGKEGSKRGKFVKPWSCGKKKKKERTTTMFYSGDNENKGGQKNAQQEIQKSDPLKKQKGGRRPLWVKIILREKLFAGRLYRKGKKKKKKLKKRKKRLFLKTAGMDGGERKKSPV